MPPAFQTTSESLLAIVSLLHFANDGDVVERGYWPIVKEQFPNMEGFWSLLVVPLTRRIELPRDDPRDSRRAGARVPRDSAHGVERAITRIAGPKAT